MIRRALYAVRADVVTEIMPQTRLPVHIKRECRLITGAIKVVENAQPLNGVQGHTLGTQICEMGGQIRSDSRKICPCFLDVLLGHGDGNILFLRNAVCSRRLVQEHIVILFAVLIQPVLLHGHQDGFLKIRPVQSVVIDGDLRGSSAVQAVQKLRVCQKHALFILTACHQIVDVRESEGLRELIPNLENAIRPDVLDRNKVLHFSRNLKLFLVLCKDRFDALNHCAWKPPFRVHRSRPSTPRSRYSPART